MVRALLVFLTGENAIVFRIMISFGGYEINIRPGT